MNSRWNDWKKIGKRNRNTIRHITRGIVSLHCEEIARIMDGAPPDEAAKIYETIIAPKLIWKREPVSPPG